MNKIKEVKELIEGFKEGVPKKENEVKLNLGCGEDYREGWINVDFNKEVKADKHLDLTKRLPFDDNSIDFVLMDHVLEHIRRDNLFDFLDELYRICKPEAILEFYVPHYTGMYALKHLDHKNFFGIGTFDLMRIEKLFNGERYNKARFILEEEKLMFFHHNLVSLNFLGKLPINGLFNISRTWQLLMERFQFLGFDEIYYRLEVKK